MKYAKALAMCGATLVAAVSIAATAHAESQPVEVTGQRSQYVTRSVSYADLNLASAIDERVLDRRVGHAVNDVCDEAVGRVDESNFRGCTYDSWDGARPQIARAVRRARDIALTGASPIAAVAITIDLGL
jgi:UrcA family protein